MKQERERVTPEQERDRVIPEHCDIQKDIIRYHLIITETLPVFYIIVFIVPFIFSLIDNGFLSLNWWTKV